ncbi:MAG: signal peptidase I [Clostridiales bacterium]|nr:signal peptidase I [Clostridiales bacterium]
MEKDDLKNLSRQELVDVVYNLVEDPDKAKSEPVSRQVAGERRRLRKKAKARRALVTALGILVVVAAVSVLVSTYLLPVIQVSGDSMEPTLSDGDVLVLLNTDNFTSGQLCCIAWQNKLLIKRVIALSGDTVDIDAAGNVSINGSVIDEPYLSEKSLGECDIEFPYIVPEGTVFVMGDHRASSIDSRSTAVGPITNDQIVGRVLGKIWPL